MQEPVSSVKDSKPTFFRRRFAPLVAAWVLALIVSALLYSLERSLPALHDVITPLYWIIAALIIIATWRWVRKRGKGDRRAKDRRRADRRKHPASLSDSSRAPDRDDVGDRAG